MTEKRGPTNRLFYGDNLSIMRDHIPDGSVDLVYLDPPFNSRRRYKVIFKSKAGPLEVPIAAFDDCWRWTGETERAYAELLRDAPRNLPAMLEALLASCGQNMAAYLVSMSIRLLELHRVLKPTGSIYLHCDPTTSHYLKIVMDSIFRARNFRNEIVWCYTGPSSSKKDFPKKHDIILRYSKNGERFFNPDSARIPYAKTSLSQKWYTEGRSDAIFGKKQGGRDEENIARYKKGKPVEDWWADIPAGGGISRKERTGYPTQKPEKLLERIIGTSSKPGDVVLDPFNGGGTTVAVAERLGRNWIGIDITPLAITMTERRLEGAFPGCQFEVVGDSSGLAVARAQMPPEEERTQERLF